MHTQNGIEGLIELLLSVDNSQAYKALKELEEIGAQSDVTYQYMDRFIDLIGDSNSYVRTRGIVLVACNAKWDNEGKIDKAITCILEHILDEKPICARQCIKSLPAIAEAKPALIPEIVSSLRNADTSCYADSMRPLVQKNIQGALLAIDSLSSI